MQSVAAALTGELTLLAPPTLAFKLGKQMVTREEDAAELE